MAGKTEFVESKPYAGLFAEVPAREMDGTRPYDTFEQLRKSVNQSSVVLDVGISTGYKTLPLANYCKVLYGIDPSEELLKKAKENACSLNLCNVYLSEGVADALPFDRCSMDLIVSLLSPHNSKEAYNALGPDGIYHIEKVGAGDKRDMKQLFGSDEKGPRGYLCEIEAGERRRNLEQEMREAGFSDIRSADIFFDCYYRTIDDLVLLLKGVPHTVRDFSEDKDREVLDRINKDMMTEKGILVRKHEIVVIGTKQ